MLDVQKTETLLQGIPFTLDAISWRSHLQECITVHTEAKYVATSEACTEALWISRLASDMGIPLHVPQLLCVSLGKEFILLCKDQAF